MEERRIGEVVCRIRRHVADTVVVDDVSADRTAAEAAAAGAVIRHESNQGKGGAPLPSGMRGSTDSITDHHGC